MGGGSMQLAAYGKQDVYLTGNPQITFFKYVYKRYSNFAIESVEHTLDNINTVDESKCIVTINSHSGDLIHQVFVQIEFEAGVELTNAAKSLDTSYLSFTNETGWAYIKEASISIGDQIIDRHYSEWFTVWNELSDATQKQHIIVNKHNAKKAYYESIKNLENPNVLQQRRYIINNDKLICYVPLQFWFNRNPGLALPIVALQHHNIKFHFTFRKMTGMFNSNAQLANNPNKVPKIKLFVDFIFLDKDERKKFATEKHQYLIEQVQQLGPIKLQNIHNLTFNHPIKELIWVCRNNKAGTEASDLTIFENNINAVNNLSKNNEDTWQYNDYFNFSCPDRNISREEVIGGGKSFEPYEHATILFNGIERFTKRKPSYFRIVQPGNHHSRIPTKHIYSYSFSLKPEDYQPSGTCNFSQIHNPQIKFDNITTSGNMDLIVYGINYNLLCIMNGMAGLRFSN